MILSVNGEEVDESNQLQQKIAVMQPGETVTLEIYRNGKELTKDVELGILDRDDQQMFASNESEISPQQGDDEDRNSRRDTRGVEFSSFDLGFRVMAISQEGGESTYDLIITDVVGGSEADQSGFKEGYQIKRVNDQIVEDLESLKDLIAEISEDQILTFEVETPEGELKIFELQP